MSDEKLYTKFEKDLRSSSDAIRGKRAEFAAQDAKAAQDELISRIEKRIRDTLRKLVKLQDIHRDSEVSLKVTKDNCDEHYWENWVSTIQDNKVVLANLEVKLKIAKATSSDWFSETESI